MLPPPATPSASPLYARHKHCPHVRHLSWGWPLRMLANVDVFWHGPAGRSATRKYKTVSRAWRHRFFGRRASIYFWVLWVEALFVIVSAHLSGRWALAAGLGLGATAVAWHLMPDALMPGWIFNWQRGAWGEEITARERLISATMRPREVDLQSTLLGWGFSFRSTTSPSSSCGESARRWESA